jgi:hypothetical protein
MDSIDEMRALLGDSITLDSEFEVSIFSPTMKGDLSVVATSGDTRVLISANTIATDDAPAQTWAPGVGYSKVRALGVYLSNLDDVQEVNPPQPWVLPQ